MRRIYLHIAVAAALAVAWGLPGVARATFPGKNGKIAFTRVDLTEPRLEIMTMNADGSGQTSLGVEGISPAWSADGSKIAFASGQPEHRAISIVNSDGTGLIKLTDGAFDDADPTWSPDGRWIAFSRFEPERFLQLYIIGTGGQGLRRIQPSGLEWAESPDWSPDGSKIAIDAPTKYPGYTWTLRDIYTVRPDGAGLTKVTDYPGEDREPSWSPDGSRIAFVSNRNPGHDVAYYIYSMAADGTGVRQLSRDDVYDINPAWSPDGTKIAYAEYANFPRAVFLNIYTMNPDGSAPANLTASMFNLQPDWQPIPGPKRGDYRNAAQFCKAEQAFWGDQFAGRYGGGPNAYGTCVSQNH